MAKLIFGAIMSLDGYIEDKAGKFDWAAPDDEMHAFVNDRERDAGTYLYGRRMYETMAAWETDPSFADVSPVMRDYARIWRAADKIVYSRTLEKVWTARTRLERRFDPETVRQLLVSSARDVTLGGPELAAHAFKAGLVDECQFYVVPIIVGGGKRALPDDILLPLELVEERRFANGTVYLQYRARK